MFIGREEALAFGHAGGILEVAAHVLVGVHGHGRHAAPRRKFEYHVRPQRPQPLVLAFHVHAFHAGRAGLVELQRQVRRSEVVHQPVAQRSAGGEVDEGAPLIRHQRIECARFGAAQPQVPIERARDGRCLGSGRRKVGLSAINAAGPGMQFLDLADLAGPEDLTRGLGALVVPALVAHLGGHFVLHRRVRQQLRFPSRSGQGLLAIDVLAVLHGEQRNGRVHVIGGGDHHRIDVLALRLEHLAIVFVLPGVGVLREAVGRALLVHVAQRNDVLGGGGAHQNRGTAHADPDRRDIQLLVRRLVAHRGKRLWAAEPAPRDRSRQQRAVEEIASGKSMIVHHVPPNRLDPLAKQHREAPSGERLHFLIRFPIRCNPPFYSQSAISRNQPYHAELACARFGTVSCIQPEWNLMVTAGRGTRWRRFLTVQLTVSRAKSSAPAMSLPIDYISFERRTPYQT